MVHARSLAREKIAGRIPNVFNNDSGGIRIRHILISFRMIQWQIGRFREVRDEQ